MNVLEKILEEMKGRVALHDVGVAYEKRRGSITDMVCHQGALEELDAIRLFIRSHMDEVPDNNAGWIPVSERLPEEGKEVLAQFTVRVVHTNNKVDEFVYIHTMYYENGAWQSFAGVPNGKVEAWQPLPEPYKEV